MLTFLAASSLPDHHVVETIFAGAMIAQGVCAWIWIMLYKYTYRQIGARHPDKFAVLWGTATKRKNSIDRLTAFLQFLFSSEDRKLRDGAVTRGCLLLKATTLAFFVFFIVMTFSPMFLPAGR
ncbi:hypothetical protein BH09VER1_BH09VER1_41150 [soil metagenome]